MKRENVSSFLPNVASGQRLVPRRRPRSLQPAGKAALSGNLSVGNLTSTRSSGPQGSVCCGKDEATQQESSALINLPCRDIMPSASLGQLRNVYSPVADLPTELPTSRAPSVAPEKVPRPRGTGAPLKRRFMGNVGNNTYLVWKLMRERPGWASDNPRALLGIKGVEKASRKKLSIDEVSDVIGKKPTRNEAFFAAKMPNFLWSQNLEIAFLDAVVRERDSLDAVADPSSTRLHNHFEGIASLCTKNGLADNLCALYLDRGYDPFGAMPLTFVLESVDTDQEWRRAFEDFAAAGQRMWLVKPGGFSNQGCGIRIYSDADEIEQHLRQDCHDCAESNGILRRKSEFGDPEARRLSTALDQQPWIVQKYIESPLLIHGRKFDIRAYCLVTEEPKGGGFTAFMYEEAYCRTASSLFTKNSFDPLAHLNNDAVQNQGENYGKFEAANKMSLDSLQKYLDNHHRATGSAAVKERIVPQMKSLMADAVRSVTHVLNPRLIDHCFEVFGFDFMVDSNYRVWLIEVNTNPCLDMCNSYLSCLIQNMLADTLRLTVDRFCPPCTGGSPTQSSRRVGWVEVFNSAGDSAAEISCTWLPRVAGKEVEHASLGRDLLTTASKPRKSPRRRSGSSAGSDP